MKVPAPEVLLALRAPNAGWLAALICALDEAHRDPGFSAAQRDLVHRLLDADHLPLNVVGAAHERLARFEAALLAGFEAENGDDAVVEASRPKLTLCVAGA
jgi:hypothetical protein